jgi:hypothetical protein
VDQSQDRPQPRQLSTLPPGGYAPAIIVAQRAAVVYSPRGMDTWDYLNQIEAALEVASALDTTVLPAAVMRAYLPKESAG